MVSERLCSSLLRSIGLLLAIHLVSLNVSYSQRGSAGFAFEAYAEPGLGILRKAPYRGWVGGVGVGYKITPEYSLWLSALAGPGRRPGEIVGDDGPRDDYGLLRISARRVFQIDSSMCFVPLLSYRISTFLLPDAATINGKGFEIGAGLMLQLGKHFETGGEAAYTYDSYHYRSGPVPPVTSFSGSDLALRFLVRFHPEIP